MATDARFMSLSAILPRGPTGICVYGQLAAWSRTRVNRRSRHCVTLLRRLPVPIGATFGISVSARLGGSGASAGAIRMSGLSVGILRSDFAVLRR